MTPKPHPIPKPDYRAAFDDWIRRVNVYRQERAKADPSYKPTVYEGPWYYKTLGIYPRGYVDWYTADGKARRKVPLVVWREGAPEHLIYHEWCHAMRVEGHNHPTDPIGGLKDAMAKGFDARSAFGILRLQRRKPAKHYKEFRVWVKEK